MIAADEVAAEGLAHARTLKMTSVDPTERCCKIGLARALTDSVPLHTRLARDKIVASETMSYRVPPP